MTMTSDLTYLSYTALLSASLWILYVICQVRTNGFLKPENYADPTVRPMPLWGHRAHRAYLNSVEVFAPFAALVIVAHILGKGDAVAIWAMGFFWLRVIHALVFWFAVPYIRTIVFTLGYFCVLGIFWQIIQ
jgi:uncharacterized MAPEG superfamily protein